MNKKTKKHKHSSHHRHHKRRYNHKHSLHHRRRTYRKRREFSFVPGSQSIPMFTFPDKQKGEKIPISIKQPMGNIVPGLRDYMKNM